MVPLVLLLSAALLATHVRPSAGRPPGLPAADQQLDELLLGAAGDGAVSSLLGDTLRALHRTNPSVRGANSALSPFPFDAEHTLAPPPQRDAAALSHLARSLASWETYLRASGGSLDHLGGLSKRNDDPPISIDLTFHLLRNMIEMAKIESQKEQAELNRKFLDEVGK